MSKMDILKKQGILWCDLTPIIRNFFDKTVEIDADIFRGIKPPDFTRMIDIHARKAAAHLVMMISCRLAEEKWQENFRRRKEASRKGWDTRRKKK